MKKSILGFVLGMGSYFVAAFATRVIMTSCFGIDNYWLIWWITLPMAIVIGGIVWACFRLRKKK